MVTALYSRGVPFYNFEAALLGRNPANETFALDGLQVVEDGARSDVEISTDFPDARREAMLRKKLLNEGKDAILALSKVRNHWRP
jgi:hypothetical protein